MTRPRSRSAWRRELDHDVAKRDGLADTSWLKQDLDISAVAAGQCRVWIRWGMGPTDLRDTCFGWNIDDVLVLGRTNGEVPLLFLGEDGGEVRRRLDFLETISAALTIGPPSNAVGGDGGERVFAFVPGSGIVEFDPVHANTVDPHPARARGRRRRTRIRRLATVCLDRVGAGVHARSEQRQRARQHRRARRRRLRPGGAESSRRSAGTAFCGWRLYSPYYGGNIVELDPKTGAVIRSLADFRLCD